LLARSSVVALALAAGGCDLVFDVGGEQDPCSLGSFDDAPTVDLATAETFSVDWDQTFAVISASGISREIALPQGTATDIDLGPYAPGGIALAPEGTSMFYTEIIEPPVLAGALRGGVGVWKLVTDVPRGTFAGTPSADVFGPRRVLVKMRATDAAVQEYEDQAGHWVAVGGTQMVPSDQAPNLTPNGLTAVYSTTEADGVTHAVYGMTRPSTAVWFGEPVKILAGDQWPQLLGKCQKLYAVHDGVLRRYDR